MKKIFTLFLALVATTALWAEDFSVDGIYYKILKTNEVEVTFCGSNYASYSNEYSGSVTIPSTVTYNGTTYSVTSIGDDAFRDCHPLTSITIPNSVTSIGDYAFYGCSSLTSITIPNSVTSIGDYAFYGCSSLTFPVYNTNCFAYMPTSYEGTYNIPEGIKQVVGGAFSDCEGLTSITIPNSVTSIGEGAFYYCTSLTSITIPNSVTNIGGHAFYGCTALTSITIPNSVTTLGNYAFYDCSALTSITIGNGVTSIGEKAFMNCSALTAVHVNDIAAWCDIKFGNSSANPICYSHNFFINDQEIKDLVIPNTVDSIHNYAFYKYTSLTSITIPNSVTSIGDGAFYGCSAFSSITCEAATPPTIGSSAFNGVSKSIPVYVPCGTVSAYNAAGGWFSFYNIQEPLAEYSIIVSVNETTMGTAKVNYNTFCGGAQISATPNIGYHFVQWNDGNTNAIRSFVLTQDTTFTAEFAPNSYAISTQSSNTERGTTSGDITTTYLDYVTISATANYGYHFSHWNDYNYDNPRQVQVTKDKTYIAYFDKNTYYITKYYDNNQGYVNGYSSGEYLDNITLTAEAHYGYHFVQWSDGNTDNPRHFILTQDTTFSAEFAQTFSGQCGDNLYWSYQNNTLTISGFGGMYDNRPWGLFINEIQHVVLPNGITHIGDDAFSDCTGLNEITIPYTVTSIGDYAFAGCRKLVHVNCYAINPPMAESTSFANYNVYLNVPCNNLQDYQLDMVFGSFKYIQCMEADSENVPTDDVVVTPGTNDVTITWPTDENADTYKIEIKRGDVVFCTLTFNKDGMLLNIAFAPSRSGSHPVTYAASTGNGLRFTVTSLDAATTYAYDITTKDVDDNTISTYTGEFTTKSNVSTSVSDIKSPMTDCQKLIRNGQLVIVRDGKTYNAMGVEM